MYLCLPYPIIYIVAWAILPLRHRFMSCVQLFFYIFGSSFEFAPILHLINVNKKQLTSRPSGFLWHRCDASVDLSSSWKPFFLKEDNNMSRVAYVAGNGWINVSNFFSEEIYRIDFVMCSNKFIRYVLSLNIFTFFL